MTQPENNPACLACGFDNSTLPEDLPCPECGTEYFWATGGPGILETDRHWRTRMVRGHLAMGVSCLSWAIACAGFAAVDFIYWRTFNGGLRTMTWETILLIQKSAYVVTVIAIVLAFVGARGIGGHEPDHILSHRRTSRLRATALICVVSGVVVIALEQPFIVSVFPNALLIYLTLVHTTALILSLASGVAMVIRAVLIAAQITQRFRGPTAMRGYRRAALMYAGIWFVSVGIAEGAGHLPYVATHIDLYLASILGFAAASVASVLRAVVTLRAWRALHRMV